jgi:hypothetical protein
MIDFYDPSLRREKQQKYGEFSNFYKSPITIDSKKFENVEHYFQYMKFNDISSPDMVWYQQQIYNQKTPGKVKYLSNQQKGARWAWMKPLSEIVEESLKRGIKPINDWDYIRNLVMINGVVEKIRQNPIIKKKLLETENKILRENSPRDSYWGIGKDQKGKNMLGKILMCLRDILLSQNEKKENETKNNIEKKEVIKEKNETKKNEKKNIEKKENIKEKNEIILWVDGACNSDTKDCAWGSVVNNDQIDMVSLYKELSPDLIYEKKVLNIKIKPQVSDGKQHITPDKQEREIIIAKATDVKSQQNNYAELLSFLFALRIANSKSEKVKEIKSDSDLIIKYWSNPKHNTNMTKDSNKNKYINESKKLREIFERNGGIITKISGSVNLADLGKHKC